MVAGKKLKTSRDHSPIQSSWNISASANNQTNIEIILNEKKKLLVENPGISQQTLSANQEIQKQLLRMQTMLQTQRNKVEEISDE